MKLRPATGPTEEIHEELYEEITDMDDLPRYPETRDDMAAHCEPDSTPSPRNRTKVLLITIGIALIAVMVGLHLAGVTPH